MLGLISSPLHSALLLAQTLPSALPQAVPQAPAGAASSPFAPIVILILCLVAGVGTVLLLPGRREPAVRKIGGVVLLAAGLIFAALLVRWAANSPGGGMGVYFWIFTVIALVGAVRVITHRRPVYSALYFVLTVFATAGLFLLLWAEFMAAALVLIYAGAILVTYVFVIMLASEATPAGETKPGETASGTTPVEQLAEHDAVSREPVVAAAVGFALMGVILMVIFDNAQTLERGGAASLRELSETTVEAVAPADAARVQFQGSTQQLGQFLFRNHIVNLELAGLILTVAMVGAIMIARRRVIGGERTEAEPETLVGPATPVDDNPHSIPVYGTRNPRQKAYPET